MNNTQIYAAISQMSEKPDYWISELESLPESKWFTNVYKYEFLEVLHDTSIICKRITPIWNNGSFVGNKIEYYWNREMRFEV